jgi:hypothetical protein
VLQLDAAITAAAESRGAVVAAGLVWRGDTHPTLEGQRVLADAVGEVL